MRPLIQTSPSRAAPLTINILLLKFLSHPGLKNRGRSRVWGLEVSVRMPSPRPGNYDHDHMASVVTSWTSLAGGRDVDAHEMQTSFWWVQPFWFRSFADYFYLVVVWHLGTRRHRPGEQPHWAHLSFPLTPLLAITLMQLQTWQRGQCFRVTDWSVPHIPGRLIQIWFARLSIH